MKKLILPLMMICASLGVFAESTALKVVLKDGNSATYVLTEKPKVTFEGENVNISTPDAQASYLRSEVASFSFIETSSVKDIEGSDTTYRFTDNVFESEGNLITVYSITGATVARGANSLSLESLNTGIYIVKAGNQSIKIRKN